MISCVPPAPGLQTSATSPTPGGKRRHFYGFNVQLRMIHAGRPVEFYILAGREADITGFKAPDPQLPAGSTLYADAAYPDYAKIIVRTTQGKISNSWVKAPAF